MEAGAFCEAVPAAPAFAAGAAQSSNTPLEPSRGPSKPNKQESSDDDEGSGSDDDLDEDDMEILRKRMEYEKRMAKAAKLALKLSLAQAEKASVKSDSTEHFHDGKRSKKGLNKPGANKKEKKDPGSMSLQMMSPSIRLLLTHPLKLRTPRIRRSARLYGREWEQHL